jgi:hypothetical protein
MRVTSAAELVGQVMRRANERMRRNPLGCYGAARYKELDRPLSWCRECLEGCEHYRTCMDIDRDPTGCVVVLEEQRGPDDFRCFGTQPFIPPSCDGCPLTKECSEEFSEEIRGSRVAGSLNGCVVVLEEN